MNSLFEDEIRGHRSMRVRGAEAIIVALAEELR